MGVFKPMLAMFMSYAHKCNIFFYILVSLTFYLPFCLIFYKYTSDWNVL